MGLLPTHPLLSSCDAGRVPREPTRWNVAEMSRQQSTRWRNGADSAATGLRVDSADSESGSIRLRLSLSGKLDLLILTDDAMLSGGLQRHRWRCAAQPSRPTRGLCDDRRRTFCTASEGRVCLLSAIEAASRGVRRRGGTGRSHAGGRRCGASSSGKTCRDRRRCERDASHANSATIARTFGDFRKRRPFWCKSECCEVL